MSKIEFGRLYLVPTPLGDDAEPEVLPVSTLEILKKIKFFVVENEKSAWRFLSRHFDQAGLSELSLSVLDEHTQAAEVPALLQPALAGQDLGVISEAGCPGIADPGASLASAAHKAGVFVCPLIGPSAILMALMGSGFNGQAFTFHGYLPRERPERQKALKSLEKTVKTRGASQLFIETPYRNRQMIEDLMASLDPETEVVVAMNVSQGDQIIRRCRAKDLRRYPELGAKKPAVFVIGR
jgi:16S rRNA (cytidine1402-2'-O)-methyltransferase